MPAFLRQGCLKPFEEQVAALVVEQQAAAVRQLDWLANSKLHLLPLQRDPEDQVVLIEYIA